MSSSLSTIKPQEIRPKKSLGQNFLIDKNIVQKIIKTANISKNDLVFEIGPGKGALTKELAKSAKKVIAIEKDENLTSLLNQEKMENVEIITGDVLRDLPEIKGKYKVVANIPYYLTSFLIRKLLEIENKPQEILLLVQKEVAQRICAPAGKMSLLAISVNYYAQPDIKGFVSKNCFWPKPKVDSAILKITPLKRKKNNFFFKIVRAGFSQPRKQLVNNLSLGLKINKEKTEEILNRTGINPKSRAQELNINDWLKLSSYLAKENIVKE